jgi:D-3-phosphoglycerate dehydrogenase
MKKYKVIITPRSFGSVNDEPIKLLEENGFEVVRLRGDSETIAQGLNEEIADADAIIAGLDDYNEALLSKAKKLKIISRYGVGYNNVDLEAAKRQDITVTITPGANDDSVADLTMALMLAAARHVSYSDRLLRSKEEKRPTGMEMWNKTLGVIGTGRIGKGVIKRAQGFNMDVLAFDLYQDHDFANEYKVQYTDLDVLLRKSDFITIHTPLTEGTRNLISTDEFKIMKEHAVIVNTARGGIIDEDALYKALVNGEIGAAAMDAMLFEPPHESPLLTLDNFTATSHLGATTYDAIHKMSMMAVQNVLDVVNNGHSDYKVG